MHFISFPVFSHFFFSFFLSCLVVLHIVMVCALSNDTAAAPIPSSTCCIVCYYYFYFFFRFAKLLRLPLAAANIVINMVCAFINMIIYGFVAFSVAVVCFVCRLCATGGQWSNEPNNSINRIKFYLVYAFQLSAHAYVRSTVAFNQRQPIYWRIFQVCMRPAIQQSNIGAPEVGSRGKCICIYIYI